MIGLGDLIEGATNSYLGNEAGSMQNYRNCINRRTLSKDTEDQHISAFALYELGSTLCNKNVSN